MFITQRSILPHISIEQSEIFQKYNTKQQKTIVDKSGDDCTSFEPGDVVISIEYEGETYDVNCGFEWGADYDYDGTVFDIGCGTKYSPELGVNDDEPYTSIDYSTPVKVDVYPFFTDTDHPHFYFSSSDK